MKAIFLGRKPAASLALRHLVDAGVEVAAVVAPAPPEVGTRLTFWRPLLRETARELGIPVLSPDGLNAMAARHAAGETTDIDLSGVDLVLSFLFWKKIEAPLIALPRIGCFNFHPAPLPGFRGRRGYNSAILENCERYGASIHWVSERFDEGNLVSVREFPIHARETALSLEQRTMQCLLEMFDDFIGRVLAGEEIPAIRQGPGRSATKREMLDAMRITPEDTPETVARKVRAFWYPPHTGAQVEVGGKLYTLVDDETLSALGRYIHGSRDEPW